MQYLTITLKTEEWSRIAEAVEIGANIVHLHDAEDTQETFRLLDYLQEVIEEAQSS